MNTKLFFWLSLIKALKSLLPSFDNVSAVINAYISNCMHTLATNNLVKISAAELPVLEMQRIVKKHAQSSSRG